VASRTRNGSLPTLISKARINFPYRLRCKFRIAINSQIVAGYNTIDTVAMGKYLFPVLHLRVIYGRQVNWNDTTD
jgi:hypothetical protein